MKNVTCLYEGEYVFMKGKRKGFRLKLMGGTREKSWKSMKNATCVHEREYAPMKEKSKGFSLKPIGGTLRKRLDNRENPTCRYEGGICVFERQKAVTK